MISGSAAATGSTLTRTSLSYINDLITAATEEGVYRIIVNEQYMDADMVSELRHTYGYHVTVRNTFMGTFNEYLISWEPAVSTAPVGGSGTITFNGTNAYVRVPNATLTTWLPGTDDFTVEFFLKRTGDGTGFPRVFSIGPDTTATLGCSIEGGSAYIWADNGNGMGQWLMGDMTSGYNSGTDWNHIAVSRVSDVTRLYINGVFQEESSNVRNIANSVNAGEPMYMGGDGDENWFEGKLTNFRWVNEGLYQGTSTITVPTSPLTNVSQTKLLLLGGSVENPVLDASGVNTLVDSNSGWDSDTPFV